MRKKYNDNYNNGKPIRRKLTSEESEMVEKLVKDRRETVWQDIINDIVVNLRAAIGCSVAIEKKFKTAGLLPDDGTTKVCLKLNIESPDKILETITHIFKNGSYVCSTEPDGRMVVYHPTKIPSKIGFLLLGNHIIIQEL
ncbi:MAG: hypothetical protein V1707_00915 [bacterium]